MICLECAAAADLQDVALQLRDADDGTYTSDYPGTIRYDRMTDVVGRPFVWTVIARTVRKLHAQCIDCNCQHRVALELR